MERMNKGDLLHIGTAYVEVHTFKGNDYITVKDFSTTTNALSKEVLELGEENKKLKSDLANIQCEFGFECDECEFWKREMKKLKPNLIKEEYVFNLGDYDYMILASTTPQLKIIKKNNKGISTFTVK